MRNFSTAGSAPIARQRIEHRTSLDVVASALMFSSVKRAMPSGIKIEARWSFSRDQKQMFLIVGHLATPLSDDAFASAAARSCREAFWSRSQVPPATS